jgi:hypothetical protein
MLGKFLATMKISYDSFHELKRYFVGSLAEPSRFWLDRAEGVHIGFSGDGVSEGPGGSVLHFGPVSALGEHRRTVEVENRGQESVRLALQSLNAWLRARWRDHAEGEWLAGAGAATLELTFRGESAEERAFGGVMLLRAEGENGEETTVQLGIHLTTFLQGQLGSYSFSGSSEAKPHDFGRIDPASKAPEDNPRSFEVVVGSLGSQPLQVVFEDLPAWLVAEVDGYPRPGPARGKFFERQAPVRLQLRPAQDGRFLGSQQASVTLRTDDMRPEWHRIALRLSARFERQRPYVTVERLPEAVVMVPGSHVVEIPLANLGKLPAALKGEGAGLKLIQPLPVIGGAVEEEPGRATLRAEIAADNLPLGDHVLQMKLAVVGGDPSALSVPVPVTIVRVHSDPDPPELAFGTLTAGQKRPLQLRLWASDGRPLQLAVRILPAMQGLLRATTRGDVVEVVCEPPEDEEGRTVAGPGIEVSDERLRFRLEVPVTVRISRRFFDRFFPSPRRGARA